MKRVCAPGGRVMVVDSAPDRPPADAFNHMKRPPDPAPVRAMPSEELKELFRAVALPALGIGTRLVADRIHDGDPVAVLVSDR